MPAACPLDLVGGEGNSLRVGALCFRLHHVGGALPATVPDRAILSRAIAAALRDTVDETDQSYWVIRRIALPFRADPVLGMSHIAEEFAFALRQKIRRILRGEVVDGVLRYDSRAHWLAECVWAQACGTASDKWQFGRFRHHAPLPVDARVRLTLAAEHTHARSALFLLAQSDRIRPFCRRMGEGGAQAILGLLLAPNRGAAPLDDRLKRLLREEVGAMPRSPNAAMLAALARHVGAEPAAAPPTLAALRREVFRTAPPQTAGPVEPTEWWSDPSTSPASSQLGVESGPIAPSAPRSTEACDQSPLRDSRSPDVLETSLAGVFVLWRSVLEMELLSLLPPSQQGGPARLALAAALTGPEHSAAWADPALHWLCGYRPDKAEAPPEAPRDLAGPFAEHYRNLRSFLPLEPSLVQVGRTWLLQDRRSEDWLALGDRERCLSVSRRLGSEPEPPKPGARDPAIDLVWFAARRRARRGWTLLARAAYGDFARRFHGLEGSSAAWLWDKLLAGWGRLELGPTATIHLPRVQLDLVLRMGGLDGTLVESTHGTVRLCLPGAQ